MNNAIAKTVSIALGVARQKRVKKAELRNAVDSGDLERVMLAAKSCLRTDDDREESDPAASRKQCGSGS